MPLRYFRDHLVFIVPSIINFEQIARALFPRNTQRARYNRDANVYREIPAIDKRFATARLKSTDKNRAYICRF